MPRDSTAWKHALRDIGAYWVHDGNPKRPHAIGTSGIHSDGYVNREVIIAAGLLTEICHDTLEQCAPFLKVSPPDLVVGCGIGAKEIAKTFASLLHVRSVYTEKSTTGGMPRMKLHSCISGGVAILVDDVFNTGLTLRESARAVEACGNTVLHTVVVWWNRSPTGTDHWDRGRVASLISHPIRNWQPAACPLCSRGSVALPPKVGDNWHSLTKAY